MGIQAASGTDKNLGSGTKAQLVFEELDCHPARRAGARTIKEKIAQKTGVHLKR